MRLTKNLTIVRVDHFLLQKAPTKTPAEISFSYQYMKKTLAKNNNGGKTRGG